MWKKRETVVAVACLVAGSAGQLAQYLVSPVTYQASAAGAWRNPVWRHEMARSQSGEVPRADAFRASSDPEPVLYVNRTDS
jgi:hypothetical protein